MPGGVGLAAEDVVVREGLERGWVVLVRRSAAAGHGDGLARGRLLETGLWALDKRVGLAGDRGVWGIERLLAGSGEDGDNVAGRMRRICQLSAIHKLAVTCAGA